MASPGSRARTFSASCGDPHGQPAARRDVLHDGHGDEKCLTSRAWDAGARAKRQAGNALSPCLRRACSNFSARGEGDRFVRPDSPSETNLKRGHRRFSPCGRRWRAKRSAGEAGRGAGRSAARQAGDPPIRLAPSNRMRNDFIHALPCLQSPDRPHGTCAPGIRRAGAGRRSRWRETRPEIFIRGPGPFRRSSRTGKATAGADDGQDGRRWEAPYITHEV